MSGVTAAGDELLWAPMAWIGGGWRESVLFEVAADGTWAAVLPDTAAPPAATRLPGPVLPSLVDAHSHAFQRAFAGMTERRPESDGVAQDDFWSWRDRMYQVALRITPAQLRAIATMLYGELLAGGYTQVCEFHYLHHAPDGRPYPDPAAMSQALIDAAGDAGIGLTLLPVLYERAGFRQPQLRADQRRFRSTVAEVLDLQRVARASGAPRVKAGVAIHSLRAARPESIGALAKALGPLDSALDGPIHIHVAEQVAEVEECLATTGMRPIEWLTRHAPLDARWQLVHATHSTPAEIEAVAAGGAGVVLCPGTEANLGDGLADLPGWLAAGVPLTLGSDSQVTRAWPEELRWLEYGQRLARRQRNVAAAPGPGNEPAVAARLFERVCRGGAAAAGFAAWGLVRGAPADALVLDAQAPGLLGVPASHRLDALVFAGAERPFAEVWVAGRRVLGGLGAGRPSAAAAGAFEQAMGELWASRSLPIP